MTNCIALRLEFPKAKIKTILIPEKYIFREPDRDENTYIFWVWNKRLNSGNTFYAKPKNLVTMNLRMLKKMHDCPEDIIGISLFMSAVLVEELSHCATYSLKNHKNWMQWLKFLQEELYE